MGKLTSAEYRARQHPDHQALIDNLVVDPGDGATTAPELLAAIAAVVGDVDSGLVKDIAQVIWQVGDYDPATTGRTITQDLALAFERILTQGLAPKLSAIASKVDAIHETLSHKHLTDIMLNDKSAAQASLDVDLAGTLGKLTITAAQPGEIGNSFSVEIVHSGVLTPVTIAWNSPALTIMLGTNEGAPFVTAYELVRHIQVNNPELFESLIFSYESADADCVVEETSEGGESLDGGVDGHVLIASGSDIDNAVDKAPTAGAPVTEQTAASVKTGDGENHEITWTAQELGTPGNGINIKIELSAAATGVDIAVDGSDINVAVEATGEPLSTIITATDVLTAVNGHATAGQLVQGVLTGAGGAIANDEQKLGGGVDITPGLPGAQRYEEDKYWINTGESTATTSRWKSMPLTDPNA